MHNSILKSAECASAIFRSGSNTVEEQVLEEVPHLEPCISAWPAPEQHMMIELITALHYVNCNIPSSCILPPEMNVKYKNEQKRRYLACPTTQQIGEGADRNISVETEGFYHSGVPDEV